MLTNRAGFYGCFAALLLAAVAGGCGGGDTGGQIADGSTADGSTADGSTVDGGSGDSAIECINNFSPGGYSNQTLTVGGLTRYYFLYIPQQYDCAQTSPLLVDLHGTAGGVAEPEISYQQGALLQMADREGVIVVRPRSFGSANSADPVYQWDANPGDLAKNEQFVRALVADLQSKLSIDPTRRYVAGFSNGTNMASQFLDDSPQLFRGFAFIGGGVWNLPRSQPDFGARVYLSTGFRDYMHSTQDLLVQWLDANSWPNTNRWDHQMDTGHDLFGWHFDELFDWLDKGQRPAPGSLESNWTAEVTGTTNSILDVDTAPDGSLWLAGEKGLLRKRLLGSYQALQIGTGSSTTNFTGICASDSGAGFAVGEGDVIAGAVNQAGTAWLELPQVPPFTSTWFPYAYLNDVECYGDSVLGTGYGITVTSSTNGASWAQVPVLGQFGYPPQGAAIARSEQNTVVVAGYYHALAASRAGAPFQASASSATGGDWINDIVPVPGGAGRWVAVADGGTVLLSTNDARNFGQRVVATEKDLYAVAFKDATTGVVVGDGGAVLATSDAGSTWRVIPTGIKKGLFAATFLANGDLLVFGEGGLAIRRSGP